MPAFIACSRLRLVAAMTRTSTLYALVEPTGRTCISCSTRRSLTCSAGRQLGDLVEEDRALVGAAEEAERIGHGARERAAHVPEELRLEQVAGDRAAVDRDERALRARRQAMNRRRHELLARAALAFDEHRRVRDRDLADDLLHALHRRASCRSAR